MSNPVLLVPSWDDDIMACPLFIRRDRYSRFQQAFPSRL